jgi:hypothetical protein
VRGANVPTEWKLKSQDGRVQCSGLFSRAAG